MDSAPQSTAPRRTPDSGRTAVQPAPPNPRRRGVHRSPDAPHALTAHVLRGETRQYRGSGGISEENGSLGFRPAFYDTRTRTAYLSRFGNGEPAPCHILDGLPDELVTARDACGRVSAVRPSLVSGFLLCGQFYNREEAARKVAELN
jgi:hypothetical protein